MQNAFAIKKESLVVIFSFYLVYAFFFFTLFASDEAPEMIHNADCACVQFFINLCVSF